MSPNKEVTGSVQIKNGKFFLVLNLYDSNGKRKQKWIKTDLPTRGNKKKAEQLLEEKLTEYNQMSDQNSGFWERRDHLLFCDYAKEWLIGRRYAVADNTYAIDETVIDVHLYPYFSEKGTLLKDVTSIDINCFYHDLRTGYNGRDPLSGTSLNRYSATVKLIIDQAVNEGYIYERAVSNIVRPKKDTAEQPFYNKEQLQELIDVLAKENSKLLVPVIITYMYGLRREEVLGLKEEDIDFNNNKMAVNHVVIEPFISDDEDGVRSTKLKCTNDTKTEGSRRWYPINDQIKRLLKSQISRNKKYRDLLGDTYNTKYKGYIFLNENGDIIRPEYYTHTIREICGKYDLDRISPKGLRHGSATMALKGGADVKDVQDYLGHASASTTTSTYAHAFDRDKLQILDMLMEGLDIPETI